MKISDFIANIENLGIEFFTGVPDSQLQALTSYLFDTYGTGSKNHIVAANEGAAIGLAAGHYLATNKPALVYMQNSGIGNTINPLASLMDTKVYAIPCLLVIGWRGEPGVKDEPQHVFQGEVTCTLLECMQIEYFILSEDTNINELESFLEKAKELFSQGKCAAIVVRKNAFSDAKKIDKKKIQRDISHSREDLIKIIAASVGENDIIVSTTGKASRELFECRENLGMGHEKDFLTVGCMGHCSMIAYQIAREKPDRTVWCIDGDGAVLMHMGSLALIGTTKPENFKHIIINNASHETVGAIPTATVTASFSDIAKSCGYEYTNVINPDEINLADIISEIKGNNKCSAVEVFCNLAARADLGRPTTTPQQNKAAFMEYLK